MTLAFLIGLCALIVLPWSLLVASRAQNDLETGWYGLVVVGVAAAVVAYGVQLGALTLWIWAVNPQPDDVHRLDFLLIAHLLLGLLLEGCKIEGIRLFQTRLTRGNWVLFGLATGAGSGLLQAVWLAGAVALYATLGDGAIENKHLWLLFRCATLIAFETVVTGLAMYFLARGRSRAMTIIVAGSAHGAVRLLAAGLVFIPALALFGQSLAYGAVATAGGLYLSHTIRSRGWPT